MTAGPQYPPCEESPPTLGRGVNVSRSMPVMELMVLMAERASAPPRRAARAARRISRDIRSELHDHRGPRHFLDPLGNHAGVIGHLADGGTHAAFAHAVGAAEIQLEAVGARVFGALDDVVPDLAFGIHHQGRDHGVMRVAFLDFGDLAKIGIDGAVADQFDVVEAHHALAVPIHRGVARRHVDDGFADGLPDGAAPAGVKGAHDLLAAIGGRTGSQPEGIGAAYAGEIGGQVSHGSPSRERHVCRRPPRLLPHVRR